MARPELPAELHELKGTASKASKANVIPLSLQAGRPTCPRHLSKAARREWFSAIRLMEARGTLDPGAGPTLLIYATTMARWLEAKANVDKNGMMVETTKQTSKGELYTVTIENPMLCIQVDAEAQLMQLTKTLGIAPDSRTRVEKVKAVARPNAMPAWLIKAQEAVDAGQSE